MNSKTQDLPTLALIVAAGRGTRAGGDTPKQWQTLAGKRVLDHTLAAFAGHPAVSAIYLVLHADDMAQASGFRAQGVHVVEGGADRAGSVRKGLDAIAAACGEDSDCIVMIHDAARPCVSARVIDGVLEGLKQADGAAPGLPLTDALWVQKGTRVSGTQDRNGLIAAQTPQAFRLSGIRRAHATYYGVAADDVEVARVAGLSVAITPGSADNLKITLPEDFKRAARILESQMDIRTGNGFDVHAFGTGDHVMLCGVKIPHERGLVGHSDADVGLHTLTDAIYGALAEGDIGTHFPPSDPQWKGAQSHIFLRHAAELARSKGFEVTHLDLTLICEEPKIGPHASAMRAAVAEMVALESDRVSIKATTSEQLGFTGRREGIAAMATATLVKR